MSVTKTIARTAAALALLLVPAIAKTEPTDVDTVSPINGTVSVEGVRSTPSAVSGRVVNETGDALENVRLLIADGFRWRNERHPGPESPGDAHTITVPGPIPPRGSATFEFTRPSPLPDRPDGDFHTEVSAIGVERRPVDSERSVTIERRERRIYQEQ